MTKIYFAAKLIKMYVLIMFHCNHNFTVAIFNIVIKDIAFRYSLSLFVKPHITKKSPYIYMINNYNIHDVSIGIFNLFRQNRNINIYKIWTIHKYKTRTFFTHKYITKPGTFCKFKRYSDSSYATSKNMQKTRRSIILRAWCKNYTAQRKAIQVKAESRFTVTIEEAEVRYIERDAPSDDTHAVQDEQAFLHPAYDHQVLRHLVDLHEGAP